MSFRKVAVARVKGEEVLIKSGLRDGEMVVISSLRAVSDGMAIRVALAKEGSGP